MSKHPGNLNRLHSKLLARYGDSDALVAQIKTEIELQKTQSAGSSHWSVSYKKFIKGAFLHAPVFAQHARPC